MGLFSESKENRQAKRAYRNREPEQDPRHWTTQRQEALAANNEGDWPQEVDDTMYCSACGEPIKEWRYATKSGKYYHTYCSYRA